MSNAEMFEGLKMGAVLYGGLYKDVVKEMGAAKALAMHGRQCEVMGAMMAEGMRAQLSGRDLTPHALADAVGLLESSMGLSPVIEETPTGAIARNTACPFYEGYKAAGLDLAAIKTMCEAAEAAEQPAVQKVLPQVSVRLEFRKTPDEPCVEIYELK